MNFRQAQNLNAIAIAYGETWKSAILTWDPSLVLQQPCDLGTVRTSSSLPFLITTQVRSYLCIGLRVKWASVRH